MKHIEVSKRVKLTREVTEEDLKQNLIVRLRRAFDVDSLTETENGFRIEGTTGGSENVTRHARIDLSVQLVKQNEIVRVFMHGHSKMARSLLITYVGLFFTVLLVGLLPGSIETSGENSGAMDTLVLMLFGIFILYDINQKIIEPKEYLMSILGSFETEFG